MIQGAIYVGHCIRNVRNYTKLVENLTQLWIL